MNMKSEALPVIFREEIPPFLKRVRDLPCSPEDENYAVHRYLRKNDITIDPTNSAIINFLTGKFVLITGATGFLGKLLIEKLLRCCQDIGGIYVIIRKKKEKDTVKRVHELLDHEIFIPLSRIFPKYRKKVIGIEGDMQIPSLGISDKSRDTLINKVNIIYHIAATVRFYEKLKIATDINVKGTKEIIRLAKQCKNLDALVHMSTAYSNCNQKIIDEKFYKPVLPPEDVIKLTELLDEQILDNITPALLGDLPNTYTFTKQIAENILKEEALGLPVCMHRPSIVFTTYREPVISWSDNLFGPIGISTGGGLGVLHIMKGKPENVADIVPADYVINSFIASSYKTAIERNLTSIPIYNYVSSPENPVTWEDIKERPRTFGQKIGSMKCVYYAFVLYTQSEVSFRILNVILHRAPAHVIDFISKMKGQKPQLLKVYDKFEHFISVLENFTMNQWTFKNDNTQNLWKSISRKDQEIFPFDMKTFDWTDYFSAFYMGLREFFVRDYLDTLEESKRYAKRLYYIHLSILAFLFLVTLWILKTILETIFF